MAKQYNISRHHTAPARTSQKSKKNLEKWETLKGWQSPGENDDTGIENWAKRRRQIDKESANSRRGYGNVCDPFMCSFTPLCAEIDDLTAFRQQSLSQVLSPYASNTGLRNGRNLVTKNPSKEKHANGKGSENPSHQEQGNVQTDESNDIYANSKTHGDCEKYTNSSQSSGTAQGKASVCCSTTGNNDVLSSTSRDVSSAAARAKRLIALSRSNNNKHYDNCDDMNGVVGHDVTESNGLDIHHSASDRNEPENINISLDFNADPPEGNTNNTKDNHTVAETKPRTAIKLSYTRSNISLQNPYEAAEEMVGENTASAKYQAPRNVTFTDSVTEKEEANGHSLGYFVTSLQDLKGSMRTVSAHSDSAISLSGSLYTRKPVRNGISTSCMRSGSTPVDHTVEPLTGSMDDGEESDQTKLHMSQRQISLVLKKVCIQDNGTQDVSVKNTVLPPKSTMRRHLNGISTTSDPITSQHIPVMPLGTLLPAVENNIKSRMFGQSNRTMVHHGSEENICASDKQVARAANDKFLSYEDSILKMKESVELINIKDKQHTLMGPPAFRPSSHQTPLQRAKENSNKRLYGQFNHKDYMTYTDMNMNALKLSSSNNTSQDGSVQDVETYSAPVTGRYFKARKLTRSCVRPLGGYAACPMDTSPQSLRNHTKPCHTISSPSLSSVDPNQLRESLGSNMKEVSRNGPRTKSDAGAISTS